MDLMKIEAKMMELKDLMLNNKISTDEYHSKFGVLAAQHSAICHPQRRETDVPIGFVKA